jgi:transposase
MKSGVVEPRRRHVREALFGFRGGGQQSRQEGAEQGFSSASGVMHKLSRRLVDENQIVVVEDLTLTSSPA